MNKYGVREAFDSYWNDAQKEPSEIMKNARATAELLALIGQKSPSLMQKARAVWGAIRQALRKMGLISISKYNDSDLAYLLAEGKNALHKPGTAGVWTVLMTAWHGSPYDFNKFSKDKIGTGEGAQAYGYGLYFAGKREVAEYYKNILSKDSGFSYGSRTNLTRQEVFEIVSVRHNMLDGIIRPAGVADRVMDDLINDKKQNNYPKNSERYEEYEDAWQRISWDGKTGRIYQVELAPTDDELLLWDKPLSEQSEKVQKAILEAIDKATDKNRILQNKDRASGAFIYHSLVIDLDTDKAVSDYLHSLGIRGIKYLDGTSRNRGPWIIVGEDGKRTELGNEEVAREVYQREIDAGRKATLIEPEKANFNYVIFDESDIEVTEKYSVKIPDTSKFTKQLDDYAAGKIKPRSIVTVGETPYILEALGAEQLPLIITKETIDKVVAGKHGLSLDTLRELPKHIADPIMVFDSATQNESLVVMTELKQDGKTIVAAIHLSKEQGRNVVNDIASVYGKDSDGIFIKWINDGLLRYMNKKKSREWSVTSGFQLPTVRGSKLGSDKKILFEYDLVKWKERDNVRYSIRKQQDPPTSRDPKVLKSISQGRDGRCHHFRPCLTGKVKM
jgi:hypothetical protein